MRENTQDQQFYEYLQAKTTELHSRMMRGIFMARQYHDNPTDLLRHKAFKASLDVARGVELLQLDFIDVMERAYAGLGPKGEERPKAEGGRLKEESIQPAAIKYYCENRKMTLKALAEKAKVPYSSMKKYAKGLRPIPDKVWEKIQGVIKKGTGRA